MWWYICTSSPAKYKRTRARARSRERAAGSLWFLLKVFGFTKEQLTWRVYVSYPNVVFRISAIVYYRYIYRIHTNKGRVVPCCTISWRLWRWGQCTFAAMIERQRTWHDDDDDIGGGTYSFRRKGRKKCIRARREMHAHDMWFIVCIKYMHAMCAAHSPRTTECVKRSGHGIDKLDEDNNDDGGVL